MKILSVRETPDVSLEAERICHWIKRHDQPLQAASWGRAGAVDGLRFRLVQHDRNLVYQVVGTKRWYLKMPAGEGRDALEREVAGAQAVKQSLAKCESYQHPAAIRVSLDPAYLLTAEVPGRMIHRQLYAGCLWPWRSMKRVVEGFEHLGQCVGCLHAQAIPAGLAAANRPIRPLVETLQQKFGSADGLTREIGDWLSAQAELAAPPTLIHGNLKMENILLSNHRVFLLDFENCGLGSAWEDLSWPLSQIALTRSVACFPWRRAYRAGVALVEGYQAKRPCQVDELMKLVTMRICRYFFEAMSGKFGRPRIAGIPLQARRLKRVVTEALQGQPLGGMSAALV